MTFYVFLSYCTRFLEHCLQVDLIGLPDPFTSINQSINQCIVTWQLEVWITQHGHGQLRPAKSAVCGR